MANLIQIEEWRPIFGYELIYEVSSLGNIRSLYFGKCKLLKQRINATGYCYVNLYRNNKYKSVQVHRIVCEAFKNKSTSKNIVNHINEIRTDNRAENLEWCTQSENIMHSIQKRMFVKKNKFLLSIDQVKQIREMLKNGISTVSISRHFAISRSTVSNIKNNKSYTKVA